MAETGTPLGSFHRSEIDGHCEAGAVKRELGWAAGVPFFGVHGSPRQSIAVSGGGPSIPSHQGVPSGRSATLVKIVLRPIVAIMFGLVFVLVPGATAKNPASGLIA